MGHLMHVLKYSFMSGSSLFPFLFFHIFFIILIVCFDDGFYQSVPYNVFFIQFDMGDALDIFNTLVALNKPLCWFLEDQSVWGHR